MAIYRGQVARWLTLVSLLPFDVGHALAGVIDGRRRALDIGGQATKGVWGMSRHEKATKGVEVCEKPGGLDRHNLIPGYPN